MLKKIVTEEEIIELVGLSLYQVWRELCTQIEYNYDMECQWNHGGKKWTYEYKYRRGGKTLCALYAKEGCIGLMIIFGKDEREKFEIIRSEFSESVQKTYDEAMTFHDGKWVMFEPTDTSLFDEYMHLLALKRKPNGKS